MDFLPSSFNPNYNHHIIIRHFKTKDDKINYSKCYLEAIPYIKFIKSYINKYNIQEVEIYTSSYDRTLITSLILYIELNELFENIIIQKPVLNKNLDREVNSLKHQLIINNFKSNYKTKGKLHINITHSSVYLKVFSGLLMGMNDNVDINKVINDTYIHTHSLSYLSDLDKEVKYGFNIKMEVSKNI